MGNSNIIEINCNLENLQKVRDFVRSQLTNYSFKPEEKNQIVLAIDEVCTNLIIHSNHNDDSKKITLSLNLIKTPKGLSIEFTEDGVPFNYENYSEPNLHHLKENEIRGGMGLILVRRIMDKIEYLRVENHNVCRLFKALA